MPWLPAASQLTAPPSLPALGSGSGAPSQPGAAISPVLSPPLRLLPPLPLLPERDPARHSPRRSEVPRDPGQQRASHPQAAALPAAALSGPAAESPQRTRTRGDSSKCAQRAAAAPAGLLRRRRRALPSPRDSGPGRGATLWPVPIDAILSPALGKHVGTRLPAAAGQGAGWGQPLLRNRPPTPTCHPSDLLPPGPP